MFDRLAAIDIGTASIKIVAVKTGFRDFQLKSLSYEEIDLSNENGTAAMVEAVTKVLHDEELRGYQILTNLPMEKEIIRNISFPFSDVEKIAEAIPYEAEENIPFRLDDLILDFLPLKSGKEGEGRILLAAAHKETVLEYLSQLNECGIKPIRMGMESVALFECYRYFNRIGDESIVQMDIGNNKTIINIIHNNQLLFTRSIAIGVGLINGSIAEALKIRYSDAVKLFLKLNLDLTSFENNIHRDHYKTLGLTRSRLKKIFDVTAEIIQELNEQIYLTIKAISLEFTNLSFNRILISGGGSNITGIGTVLSREFEIPVVSTPFLEDYKEQAVRTQFPIAFGMILSHVTRRGPSINFLKGEFIPDVAGTTRKIYYLAGLFAALTVLVLLVNLILSTVYSMRSERNYEEIIAVQYRRYFNTSKVSDDPIADAKKFLKNEKYKISAISQLIQEDVSVLDTMKDIVERFPKDASFELKNMIIQQHVVRIDGSVNSSKSVDDFKESLISSKKFEHVAVNIIGSLKNQTRFTMTIKQKTVQKGPNKGKDQ